MTQKPPFAESLYLDWSTQNPIPWRGLVSDSQHPSVMALVWIKSFCNLPVLCVFLLVVLCLPPGGGQKKKEVITDRFSVRNYREYFLFGLLNGVQWIYLCAFMSWRSFRITRKSVVHSLTIPKGRFCQVMMNWKEHTSVSCSPCSPCYVVEYFRCGRASLAWVGITS